MDGILSNYAQFFSLGNFEHVILDPTSWAIIASLVILEGLLSADNALVLAMMVKHLPEDKQKKALTYGIWGAYIFRFLVIGVGTYLIKMWWVKALGAGYLMYLAIKGLWCKEEQHSTASMIGKGFWSTIVSIEIMDIAFSVDSVAAALGISEQVWVLFLGAIFGILMMRGVATVFVTLINKIPELEKSAYILIAIISVKMFLGIFHIEIHEIVFFGIMIAVFVVTWLKHNLSVTKQKNLAKLQAGKTEDII